MKRILRSHLQDLEIVDCHETDPGGTFLEFFDESSALNFLREFAHDYFDMLALRSILEDDLFDPNLSLLGDRKVLQELAWRLASGKIKIRTSPFTPEETYGGSGGTPTEPEDQEEEEQEEEEEPAEEAAAIAPEPDWIKFRVVEDETGQPVSGVTLKVKLPTGEIWDFTTDGNGEIEIKDIPSGTCAIMKMTDADALEVVQVS